jgi:membrane protease YdiL (CAAX protease family)
MEAVRKRTGALHSGLFFAVLCLTAVGLPALAWPWYLLLPLLAYAGIALAFPPLRRTAPRLTVGRLGGRPLACAAALTVSTSAVLIGFHALFRPDVTHLAAQLPVAAFGLIVAGICFSVVNAALEEFVFRGVLWELIADERNNGVAFAATTLVFGVCHLRGYPPGPLGAVLAGLYGLALGLLRWWTGGLGLAVGCHVCADATIFGMLLASGAIEQRAG